MLLREQFDPTDVDAAFAFLWQRTLDRLEAAGVVCSIPITDDGETIN
jgi:hypothetical protein